MPLPPVVPFFWKPLITRPRMVTPLAWMSNPLAPGPALAPLISMRCAELSPTASVLARAPGWVKPSMTSALVMAGRAPPR
jgi:hypothetical protein